MKREDEKAKDTLGKKEAKKVEVKDSCRYVQSGVSKALQMHEIKKSWCKDNEEWKYVRGVQNVLGAIKWKEEQDDEGGITWIELYAVYSIHGGGEEDRKRHEDYPLRKPLLLQNHLAEFKKAVRKIKKHAAKSEDEWMLETCYTPKNRLQDAAIENRQAAIKGLPCLEEKDAKDVMRMMMALRGINGKKQVDAWREGCLKVTPQKLRLQKMAAGWSKAMTIEKKWIGPETGQQSGGSDQGSTLEQDHGNLEKEMPMTNIFCPRCGASQDPKGMRLVTTSGFSNVMCKICNGTFLSSVWRCRCRIPWIKCPRHVHIPST